MTPRSDPPPNAKLSTELPVLQKIADAYKLWLGVLPHLPRLSRYTLGAKIDTLFLDTIEHIVLAGYAPRDRKLDMVLRASSKVDLLKVFLQLAWDQTEPIAYKASSRSLPHEYSKWAV